ncbi:MAG: hypothetical protein B7Y73_02760 [Acidocella sp. 35-58-6]|nr:MAG: hypothetical protein B7Y73_02760 [Acidocella sp. 35-58-6]
MVTRSSSRHRPIMRRDQAITGHHRFTITAPITTALTEPSGLLASTHQRTSPRPPDPQRPWFWLAALALHAFVIALFLISFERRQTEDFQTPTGVSVVFDTPGAQQTQAPPHQVEGPTTPAQAPPPAAPPPPEASQPEVNLNMPAMPLAALPAPTPQRAQPQPQHRQAKPSHQAPHYVVMNNMSFGSPSPPVPFAQRSLNLNLAAADLQAAAGQTLTIKGDAGSNWDAALNKWVNEHAYYPDAAIAQNQQGSVKIQFTVDRAGNVSGIKLLTGSGSPFLDQAWPGLFKDAQLPPFPPDAKSDTVTVTATMHYILLH